MTSNHTRTHTGEETPSSGVLATVGTAPDGEVSVNYSYRYTWSGGQGSVTFAATDPLELPDGLSLDSHGRLTGTPTVAATFNFTVRGTDHFGNTDDQADSIVIVDVPTLSGTFDNGTQDIPGYDDGLDLTGGTSPFVWDVLVGPAPPGLSIDPDNGHFTGTPLTAGAYPMTIIVTDANGVSDTMVATLTVDP